MVQSVQGVCRLLQLRGREERKCSAEHQVKELRGQVVICFGPVRPASTPPSVFPLAWDSSDLGKQLLRVSL